MSEIITKENFIDGKYDVFKKFHQQLAVVSVGGEEDFRCMTIGWGMMGNIWGHPGSALSVYVSPSRHTCELMQKEEYFVVSFFPEEYKEDVITLGKYSSRDGDKVSRTKLHKKVLEKGIGFEEAELTFVCRKLCAQQFDPALCPENIQKNVYTIIEPHYMFIGGIEDAFGEVK